MDARALLRDVVRAYRALDTLQIEALLISESEDEGSRLHREARLKFHYQAPDRVRVEQPGRQRSVLVSDGSEFQSFFAAHQRHFRNPAPPLEQLPGVFLPEFPLGGDHGPFLFHTIEDRLIQAELAGEACLTLNGAPATCHVLAVRYEPSPAEIARVNRPIRFWIDTRTKLVLRLEGEFDLRHPRDGAVTVNKRVIAVTYCTCNEPLPAGIFTFTPPPGVSELAQSRGMAGGGGAGVRHSPDPGAASRLERSTVTIGGHPIEIERRWAVLPDESELVVTETIHGPKGTLERSYTIRLR